MFIAKQIIGYETNDLFTNVQHGYRQGRSITTSITDFIISALEGLRMENIPLLSSESLGDN